MSVLSLSRSASVFSNIFRLRANIEKYSSSIQIPPVAVFINIFQSSNSMYLKPYMTYILLSLTLLKMKCGYKEHNWNLRFTIQNARYLPRLPGCNFLNVKLVYSFSLRETRVGNKNVLLTCFKNWYLVSLIFHKQVRVMLRSVLVDQKFIYLLQ